ncbi:MAG: putative dehydrogenase [Candidatus Promineifilaceae bacterium]|jgi:predicted dehydrogenase
MFQKLNPQKAVVRATMIGAGGMARHHFRQILTNFPNTTFPVVCEPSAEQYQATVELFKELGQPAPANEPNLDQLIAQYADQLDVAFIITPHKFHYSQTVACLEAGVDVLLEKPMVMTADEAKKLIKVRDKTGRVLVVAFQGSLSPEVRMADNLLRAGILGTVRNIDAQVWQNWNQNQTDTWRQNPELSGGGFMFDTGAHMLNTVSDLAGEPFVEVAAFLDNLGRPVDILGVVIGRLASGTLVTLNACGEAFESCHSEVKIVGTKAMMRTGVWGRYLDIRYKGDQPWTEIPVPPTLGVWEQFLAVRLGLIENPSPPEVGLRMAHLWDAIKESAANGGSAVKISQ